MQEKDVKFSEEHPHSRRKKEASNDTVDINTDENMAGTTHLNETVDDESETEKLREELQQQKEKYVRLFAEFDNYRKRTDREKADIRQTAGKDIMTSLLDVLDDLERAEKQLQESPESSSEKEGVQLVFNKLRNVLQARGLKVMESINTDFDVEKHEAIAEVPAPNPQLRGKVIDEVQKGYYLNDKIIRYAKVVVGK